jgi:plasmid stabilization system protein ParE
MEVIWTRQAIQMVNDFVDYITQDDYETAERWVIELMNQTDKLADHPRIGRVVPEYNEETLRELIVGNYRLPYRIKEERIYIEAVWHVRQIPPEKE